MFNQTFTKKSFSAAGGSSSSSSSGGGGGVPPTEAKISISNNGSPENKGVVLAIDKRKLTGEDNEIVTLQASPISGMVQEASTEASLRHGIRLNLEKPKHSFSVGDVVGDVVCDPGIIATVVLNRIWICRTSKELVIKVKHFNKELVIKVKHFNKEFTMKDLHNQLVNFNTGFFGFANVYIANQEELGNIQIAHQVGELVDQENNLHRIADHPEETANYNLVVGQGVQNLEVDYGQSTIPSEGSLPPNEGFVGQSVVSENILDNAADEYIHRGDVEGLPEPEDLRLAVNPAINPNFGSITLHRLTTSRGIVNREGSRVIPCSGSISTISLFFVLLFKLLWDLCRSISSEVIKILIEDEYIEPEMEFYIYYLEDPE